MHDNRMILAKPDILTLNISQISQQLLQTSQIISQIARKEWLANPLAKLANG